ncbi:MAG: GDSL-type esterase/lipase family protein [Planctomycetes bacterium]|nr:GDSL-type esterase/lipase family protein [Planctomycetota bacterium]
MRLAAESTRSSGGPRVSAWVVTLLAFTALFASACRTNAPRSSPERDAPRTELPREPERWLVLGDSIAWDGRWAAHLQTWLACVDGEAAADVIDCALPSETLSCLSEPEHLRHGFPRPCLFERLARVLDAVRPDFVLVCYGMNDALYQPFDEARFAPFRAGVERLARELARRQIEFVLLTPPPFDETRTELAPGARYDDVLGTYSAWLVAQRFERGATLDLHGALVRRLASERLVDPASTLSPDGVHLDERGQRLFACELIAALSRRRGGHLAEPPLTTQLTLTAELTLTAAADAGETALELVRVRRDAWLSETGHTRPGLPRGLPVSDATKVAAGLRARMLRAASDASSPR